MLQDRYNFIAIEGNIGVGKTTLATMLSERFNSRLILEEFEDNPFLPKFYGNREKYSFPLELSFLAERYHQLKNLTTQPDLFHKLIVSDYFIGKSLVFAQKNLDEDERKLFRNIFNIMLSSLPKPDLIVFLHSGVEKLQNNIKKRGRSYEMDIKSTYLMEINDGYSAFLKQYQEVPLLILDVEQINFVEEKKHFDRIIELIDREYSVGRHFETLV